MLDVVLVRVARWPNESAKIRKTAEFEKLRQMKITSISYPNWSNQANEPNKIRPNSTKYWNCFQLCKYHYTYIMYHIWLFSYFLLIFAKRQLTEFWKKKFRNEPNLTTNRADGSKTFGNPGPCANHESTKKLFFRHI